MDLPRFVIYLSVIFIVLLYGIHAVERNETDGFEDKTACHSIAFTIQNCTASPDYNLIDNMPIVMNATEIRLFCLNKDTTLGCIEESLAVCEDKLSGILAVLYDIDIFNITYNTLCDNMELTWWSETNCILQLDNKLRECRPKKNTLLNDVQATGNSKIYCQNLEELYMCNTYQPEEKCKQNYSDYLTKFYRGTLTPSICKENLNRNQSISYKASVDAFTTKETSVSGTVGLGIVRHWHAFFLMSITHVYQ